MAPPRPRSRLFEAIEPVRVDSREEAIERVRDGDVLVGKVTASGSPVAGAYVRLLDGTGEFTAEVVASPTGDFRFFAAPGTWKVRSLAAIGKGERVLDAEVGLNETTIVID